MVHSSANDAAALTFAGATSWGCAHGSEESGITSIGGAESPGLEPSDDFLPAMAELVSRHDVIKRQKHCLAVHLGSAVKDRLDLRWEDLTVPFVLAH